MCNFTLRWLSQTWSFLEHGLHGFLRFPVALFFYDPIINSVKFGHSSRPRKINGNHAINYSRLWHFTFYRGVKHFTPLHFAGASNWEVSTPGQMQSIGYLRGWLQTRLWQQCEQHWGKCCQGITEVNANVASPTATDTHPQLGSIPQILAMGLLASACPDHEFVVLLGTLRAICLASLIYWAYSIFKTI